MRDYVWWPPLELTCPVAGPLNQLWLVTPLGTYLSSRRATEPTVVGDPPWNLLVQSRGHWTNCGWWPPLELTCPVAGPLNQLWLVTPLGTYLSSRGATEPTVVGDPPWNLLVQSRGHWTNCGWWPPLELTCPVAGPLNQLWLVTPLGTYLSSRGATEPTVVGDPPWNLLVQSQLAVNVASDTPQSLQSLQTAMDIVVVDRGQRGWTVHRITYR